MLCETLINLGRVYLLKGDKIQAGDLFSNAAQRYFEQNMLERGCDALLEKVSGQYYIPFQIIFQLSVSMFLSKP